MNPDISEDRNPHTPLVSVVIPAYNAADLTLETVESVLSQTYPEVEILVVDDGSTDHTRDALDAYSDRVAYIYKENGGACSARNTGLRASTGEYVAFLDCDDLWLPEKLSRSVNALEGQPEAGMVFTSCLVIDGPGTVIDTMACSFEPDNAYEDLLNGNFVPAPTVVTRRSCALEVGEWDERIFVPADWDYWIRMAERYPICYLGVPLSKYRLTSNYSIRNVDRSLEEIDFVIAKHVDVESTDGRRIRRKVLAQACLDFALSFRSISDLTNARRLVRQAALYRSSIWRVYAHVFLSFFGRSVWGLATGLKDSSR